MPLALRALLLVCVLATGGCALVERSPKGRSPLVPLATAPDTVTLEIFIAPTALGDPQLAALWDHVDEQSLPAELRARLSRNGLRAGIVGPSVPAALATLLKVTDERISPEERSLVPLEGDSEVKLVVLQPRAGKRHEQIVSQTYDELPLLTLDGGQVQGRTYHKAEGRLALRVYPEADGRVRLELTPELQYGEFKNHFTSSEAMLVMKQERQKQVFQDLKLSPTLGAGQMFVLTCLPDRPGSIGHSFFTQPDGEKLTQKVYVIRVAQAGPDRTFWDAPQQASEVSSDAAE